MLKTEKEKKYFSFSFINRFCYPVLQQAMRVLSLHYLVHKYKQYLYVLAIVFIAPREGTCPHHQAYWLLAKKTPSTEKVFLITSQMLVLVPSQYKKKLFSFEQLPSLYSICVTGIVFLKTSLSLSRALALSRNRSTLLLCITVTTTLAVFIVCCCFQ